MKITIVTDVLGIENNGTTITIKRLIENLKERGYDLKIVSPYSSDEEGYYPLKKRNFFIFNKYIEKNGVALAAPKKTILEKAIEGADVVHIVLPFKTGRLALKIAQRLNIPVTSAYHCQAENVTAHFGLKNFKPANNYIYKRFLRTFYKNIKYVHCPSLFIANEIKKRGYNMDLRVISNGVTPVYKKMNVEKPKELDDKFCILFIGRLAKEKRHDLLINAVEYSKYKDKIQLIFAGDGPLKKKLIKLGSKLKNKPIFGFFKKEKLVEIINYCDLYVHPSDIEIEAIACIEAITCGKAPLISDSPRSATNTFALSDKNLFKAGSAKDLAQKIDFFIENPDTLKQIEKEYQNYAEQFQISKSIDKMEQMFKDAIENHKKQSD